MKSLALVGSGEKKSNTRFVVVIDHLVRSEREFINRALLRWTQREFGNLREQKSSNLLVILPQPGWSHLDMLLCPANCFLHKAS